MTKEAYKRAREIDCELQQLAPAQRELEKADPQIYFGSTASPHKGLREAVRNYVYNRIKELNKEFYEL